MVFTTLKALKAVNKPGQNMVQKKQNNMMSKILYKYPALTWLLSEIRHGDCSLTLVWLQNQNQKNDGLYGFVYDLVSV